jgi:hypothetical protein
LDYRIFEKISQEDIILPTGDEAGIFLKGKKHFSWEEAAYHYNSWKKHDLFNNKWKFEKKPARIDDLIDIDFPFPFTGGNGKGNVSFKFYTVPLIEKNRIFLIHFLNLEDATRHFESISKEWEKCKQDYKKSQLHSIFVEKGWKVKK